MGCSLILFIFIWNDRVGECSLLRVSRSKIIFFNSLVNELTDYFKTAYLEMVHETENPPFIEICSLDKRPEKLIVANNSYLWEAQIRLKIVLDF